MGVELTYSPSSLPGCCKSCGGSGATKLPMVDTKTSEEFHGAVYYCRECLYDMAALYGFMLPESSDEVNQRNKILVSQNEQLQSSVKALEGVIDGLVSSGSYSFAPVPDAVLYEVVANPEDGSQGSNEVTGVGEGETSESTDDSLLAGVHTDKQQSPNTTDEFRLNL